MKTQIILSLLVLACLGAFAQTRKSLNPSGTFNMKTTAQLKCAHEKELSDLNPGSVMPVSQSPKSNAKKNGIVWQAISSSMNIHGTTVSYCKPLQWNDNLNAVSFIHRKSAAYQMSPTPNPQAETGGIVALISSDCGTTWDSTALYANDIFWGRYPGGAIYNPAGNTSINNAYVVGSGPTTGAGSAKWTGNWYASKPLGTANYNNTPSIIANAVQIMPTLPPFAPGVPSSHNFATYNFTATDDGKVRVLAGINDDPSNKGSDTAVMLMTGVFNNSSMAFNWAGEVFDPPTTVAADHSENWIPRPMMAWNESGTIGYIVIIGSRSGATGSNVGYQPIVYKTTNSGSTWHLKNGIDFNESSFNYLKSKLWNVASDTNLVVPGFLWMEGMDCTVDSRGALHIFTSLIGHASNHVDSLGFVNRWSSEQYIWPHAAIKENGPVIHPFLWDFIYDGDTTWSHFLIDSMATESIGAESSDPGYHSNPWEPNSNTTVKVRIDARLQMSRTPDGKYLLYSWTESDTAYTDYQEKWNNLPNIKTRLYIVEGNWLLDEVDLTRDAQGEVANHATCHFISPKFKLVSNMNQVLSVELPVTTSNSSPYSPHSANTHWYSCAAITVQYPVICTTAVSENEITGLTGSNLYPNPAKDKALLTLTSALNSKLQISVLHLSGEVIKTFTVDISPGNNTIPVDITSLPPGVYLVKLQTKTGSETKKIIIE